MLKLLNKSFLTSTTAPTHNLWISTYTLPITTFFKPSDRLFKAQGIILDSPCLHVRLSASLFQVVSVTNEDRRERRLAGNHLKEREDHYVPICICSRSWRPPWLPPTSQASFTEEVINPGEVTYKIFLNYTNPLDKQLAVSGNANYSALELTANSPLIQKHLVEAVPADVPGALALPTTLGSPSVKASPTAVRPSSPRLLGWSRRPLAHLISGDGFVQADNGGYFDSNPSTSVEGTSILIAQFTFAEGTMVYSVPPTSTQMAPT